VDLIEALKDAGIPYHESQSTPDEIYLCCPFCVEEGEPDTDTRFRLGVNVTDFRMHCYNCKKAANSDDGSHASYTIRELRRALELGMFEAAAARKKKKKYIKGDVKLPEDFELVDTLDRHDKLERRAWKLVREKGITKKQIREKEIGYSMVDRFYKYRILIPVMYKGKLMGVVGRDFSGRSEKTKKCPKYKNSIGKKSCYNVPKKRARKAILIEGCFDALAVERAFEGHRKVDSIGSLGDSLTPYQVAQLVKYEEIALWPDPDRAGVLGFLKMAKPLWGKVKLSLVIPKFKEGEFADSRDPDELPKSTIRKRYSRRIAIGDLEMTITRWKLRFKEDE
jgi:hypothetical protein